MQCESKRDVLNVSWEVSQEESFFHISALVDGNESELELLQCKTEQKLLSIVLFLLLFINR